MKINFVKRTIENPNFIFVHTYVYIYKQDFCYPRMKIIIKITAVKKDSSCTRVVKAAAKGKYKSMGMLLGILKTTISIFL